MLERFRLKHYWTILIAQVVLLFIAAFMEEHPVLYGLFAVSLVFIFGAVIAEIRVQRWPRRLAIVSGIVVLVSGFIGLFPGLAGPYEKVGIVVLLCSYAAFVLIAIIAMLGSVFVTDDVTTDQIVGSICIYLLIGMFFAFVFAAMDMIDPRSFNFGFFESPQIQEFREYLYFSYTTITTLGYGDMIPQQHLARLVTSLEAIAGPIYLAIMVARLVGMHISQSVTKQMKK